MKDGFISDLEILCTEARSKNKRVGLTNGCFDLLHDGHLYLLKEAKKYCDILIVAVNSDESVKRLKGNSRPIDNRGIRYKKLLSTHLVNMIVGFDSEQDLLAIMKESNPDVLIKGADYHGLPVTGAGYVQKSGGKIVMIPLLQGFSTSNQIEGLKRDNPYVKMMSDEQKQ